MDTISAWIQSANHLVNDVTTYIHARGGSYSLYNLNDKDLIPTVGLSKFTSTERCMEAEFTKESVIRGHEDLWRPVVVQLLPFLSESNNCHDKRAVAIYLDL